MDVAVYIIHVFLTCLAFKDYLHNCVQSVQALFSQMFNGHNIDYSAIIAGNQPAYTIQMTGYSMQTCTYVNLFLYKHINNDYTHAAKVMHIWFRKKARTVIV